MKKLLTFSAAIVCLISTVPSFASTIDEDSCGVIGVREPNTNNYAGPTFCKNVSLSYLTVRGPLQIDTSTIKGKTSVSGPIKASATHTKAIEIENNYSRETISLQNGSIVDGNISFNGLEGIVYVDASSKINGKVLNAKIINN